MVPYSVVRPVLLSMPLLTNSRLCAPFCAALLVSLAAAPALAEEPDATPEPASKPDAAAVIDGADETDEVDAADELPDVDLDMPVAPRPSNERPKLEIEVPLGHNTRAVADFVAEFVTSGVVVNDHDEGTPDHRIHRVRGSYKRGALAISWRVSF